MLQKLRKETTVEELPKSKGEVLIEQIMRDLDPGCERYQVLATAKDFKSSWVALGERLMQVKGGGTYREWGYSDFDEYCSREVRIKKQTAEKLTLAYRYMEKEEPQLVARQAELNPLPDYRSIDLLRQAKEEQNFSEDEYQELRQAVVEDNRSHPTILKRFKEVASAHDDSPPDPAVALKKAISAARRLDGALGEVPQVPEEHRESLRRLAFYLEDQAGLLGENEE